MQILLPPSETKRDGGSEGSALDLTALSFPELVPQRKVALSALGTLSRNLIAATGALRLGPKQRFEVDRNRIVRRSPTMPALDRYTGVLFDGLAAESLDAVARAFARDHVVVHSALFGLLGAEDPIPAYRLSHDSRLPGVSLKRHWRDAVASSLEAQPGLILDLRSEAYVAMGSAPARDGVFFLRVVTRDERGAARALNHFNKKGKGEFVRRLLDAGIDHPDADSLLAWAAANGIDLRRGASGELELTV